MPSAAATQAALRLARAVNRAHEQASELRDFPPVVLALRAGKAARRLEPVLASARELAELDPSELREAEPSKRRIRERVENLQSAYRASGGPSPKTMFLGLGGGLLVLLWLAARSSKPALASGSTGLPAPKPLPSPSPLPTPKPPTVPEQSSPDDGASHSPTAGGDWRKSAGGLVTLNSLTGYHRAKQREVGPKMVAASTGYLAKPVGTLHLVDLDSKSYAVAIEEHNNHPELGTKNKGVSIWVKDG